MTVSFQPVTLDGDGPDREALLVFRDARLLAVLTRLDALHAPLAGKWFVETMFGDMPPGRLPVFDSGEAFVQWLPCADR